MRITRVTPSRVWNHIPTGRKASIYGACPWYQESEKADWEIVTRGWTWEVQDSRGSVTIGMGHVPAKTEEEAIAFMNECNAKWGHSNV